MGIVDLVVTAVAAAVLAAVLAVLASMVFQRRREAPGGGVLLLQQQLDALRGQMAQRLDEVGRTVSERLAESAQMVQRANESLGQRLDANLQMVGQRFTETTGMVTTVHERLKGVEEAAERIFDLGKDLASLQEILQPPKMRGGVGELLLENLLANMLPQGVFETQYRFADGTVVDAVIRLGGSLVPVDSKFPLEAFHAILRSDSDEERARSRREFDRQVQVHVRSIAEKYIQPQEGTYDFALMYVPAENVYYEAVMRGDEAGALYALALSKKVIPVSPTTFYAYLTALAYGLKGLQVERQAAKIREDLTHLAMDMERIRDPLVRLGTQLRHSQNNYELLRRAMDRFGDRLGSLGGVPLPEETGDALPPASQTYS